MQEAYGTFEKNQEILAAGGDTSKLEGSMVGRGAQFAKDANNALGRARKASEAAFDGTSTMTGKNGAQQLFIEQLKKDGIIDDARYEDALKNTGKFVQEFVDETQQKTMAMKKKAPAAATKKAPAAKGGMTAAQKKLPPFIQAAIAKKKKK